MKEVLTKSFWQGVKKTFHEALEGPPPENKESLAADNPEAYPAAEVPPSPSKRKEI